MWTVASVEVTFSVLNESPLTGSITVSPRPSAASLNVYVNGVVSTRYDWLITPRSGAIRTLTPFTTGSVGAKLSNTENGRRNSR